MQHTHRRSIGRRLIAAVTVAVVVSSATLDSPAEAARTSSAAVATTAEQALEALETWHDSRRPAHYVRYLRARERAAEVLAAELRSDDLEISGSALAADWASADERRQLVVLSALSQLGVPYRKFASAPDVAFDCSGLTSWAWSEVGVELPRSSRLQIRAADRVDPDDTSPGDLVYYPGHVSLYLGAGLVVHSPNSGSQVEVVAMSNRSRLFGDPLTAELLAELEPPPAVDAALG